MAILEVRNLKFSYTNIDLYSSLDFDLNSGEHIVIVGTNGCGKSTFMKLISGKLNPDSGTISWLNGTKYAYLDQQLSFDKDIEINTYLYDVYNDLFKREAYMNDIYNNLLSYDANEQEKMLYRAEEIREYLETNGFYLIEPEINNVICGLGLNRIDLNRKLSNLSGGEKEKVHLAKLLLEKPNCILMDEPTNFLDKQHVEWLQTYLNNFNGGFVVISHDTEFIKGIAKIVYAFEGKSLVKYKGDYNYYLKERDVRHQQIIEAYKKQQNLIKKTEIFIQKNLARASTTKMAQSRRRMLEKLDIIDRPTTSKKIEFRFPYSKDLGDIALKINDLVIGYNEPLLPEFSYILKKNERVEIIGKNGIGKSTLIKTILGIIKPISGEYIFNPSATINYFSQEEEIDQNITPLEYIRSFYPLMDKTKVMQTLASLGVKGDLALKKFSELSGGEVERTRLSLLTLKKSNFLILDEPTNHLDKESKEALKIAIDEFEGCVIIVSHEKGFSDGLVDTVIKF